MPNVTYRHYVVDCRPEVMIPSCDGGSRQLKGLLAYLVHAREQAQTISRLKIYNQQRQNGASMVLGEKPQRGIRVYRRMIARNVLFGFLNRNTGFMRSGRSVPLLR